MSKLFVDEIVHQSSQGSGTITLGASGETVALASGASQTMAVNTPAFYAHLSSNQTIGTASYTKVQFDTELFDTDNAYDNSTNYRFTVPSGEAGKYFIHGQIMMTSSTDFDKINVAIYVNGSLVSFARTSNFNQNSQSVSNIRSLSVGDYVEIYIYHQQGSNQNIEGSNQACHFYMSKLIGV